MIYPSWALPKEEIPLHVKIAKEITSKLKNAKIDLPECFELKDTINLTKYKILNRKIIVNSIGKAVKSDYDYFGVIIATSEPFEELKKQIPIEIEFEYNDGTNEKEIAYARIFRPLLEFEKVPENIVLTDNESKELKLPIRMKFTGFGEINIRSECSIEGQIVSVGTSVLNEVLRRIISEGIISEDKDSDNGVIVDQNYVEKIITQLKDKLHTDEDIQRMIHEQQIDKELVNFLYELDKDKKEKFMKTIYKTVEGYLVKIISDILQRNLSNNSQIESQTKIHTQIKLPSTNVTIKFFYKDIIGNEYQPIEKTIAIIDKRKNPSGFDVEIPLEITNVDESDAYKNVGTMKIGAYS